MDCDVYYYIEVLKEHETEALAVCKDFTFVNPASIQYKPFTSIIVCKWLPPLTISFLLVQKGIPHSIQGKLTNFITYFDSKGHYYRLVDQTVYNFPICKNQIEYSKIYLAAKLITDA